MVDPRMFVVGLAIAAAVGTLGCDAADLSPPQTEPAYRSEGDVGTYQYFYLSASAPLHVDDDQPASAGGELWIYDAQTGVPEHIEGFVMEPRPDAVIVTQSFAIEYTASEPVRLSVRGTEAEFRLMVVGLDGWVARSSDHRETFDCVELTPDGLHLTGSDRGQRWETSVAWPELWEHGEPQLLALPLRTTDGTSATGDDGQRRVSYGLRAGCG